MVALSGQRADKFIGEDMAVRDFTSGALPQNWRDALLLGRLDLGEGPTPVLARGGDLFDMSRIAPTVSDLMADRAFDTGAGRRIGTVENLPGKLLSPIDLHCVKAAGVTFAVSAIERVIEERARGNSSAAAAVRGRLEERIGGSIRSVTPGSAEAEALKAVLIEDGM